MEELKPGKNGKSIKVALSEDYSGNLYEDLTQERVESYLKALYPDGNHNKHRINGFTGKQGAIGFLIAYKNYDNSMSEEEIGEYRKKLEEVLPEGTYKI